MNEGDFEYSQKRSIGCEDRWIRKRLEAGRHFRLDVFYRTDQCIPATWDGVLPLIDKYHSKSISAKICQHSDIVSSRSTLL